MQKELFEIGGPVVEASRISGESSRWMDRFRVTLRLDHLFIAAILGLVLYVLVFSFGVEKGKQFALAELEASKQRQVEIARQLRELKQSRSETMSASEEPLPVSPSSETPAAAPVPSETTGIGKYTIQVITFTQQGQAEQEVERWTKRGHPSFIIPSGRFFQVCVESFESAGEARERLTRFRQEGFVPPDAYVRPFPGHVAL